MIYKNKELLSLPGVKGEHIEGVEIKLLKKIPDERGTILHMVRWMMKYSMALEKYISPPSIQML